jgi:hypothetical protein
MKWRCIEAFEAERRELMVVGRWRVQSTIEGVLKGAGGVNMKATRVRISTTFASTRRKVCIREFRFKSLK